MERMERNALILLLFTALVHQLTGAEEEKLYALQGESLKMPCDLPKSATSVVVWKDWVYNNGQEPNVLYNSSTSDKVFQKFVEKGFSVEPSSHTLVFGSAEGEGVYWCEVEDNGKKAEKKYDLTLYPEKPKCTGQTSYKEGDDVKISCSLDDGRVLTIHPFLENSPTDELSFAQLEANFEATPELDGKTYECRIDNHTRFSCAWSFNIKYQVRDLEGPSKKSYVVGEMINCTAKGNPKPEMIMLINDKEVISETSTQLNYKLGEDLVVDGGILVKCLARNNVGKLKTLEQTSNITVEHLPAEGQNILGESGNIILIIIIIIIALIFLLIIIAFLLYRRKKSSQTQKTNQATLLKAENRKDYHDEIEA